MFRINFNFNHVSQILTLDWKGLQQPVYLLYCSMRIRALCKIWLNLQASKQWKTHPEYDGMVQVVEELVELPPELILLHWVCLWVVIVIGCVKSLRDTPEHPSNSQAVRL